MAAALESYKELKVWQKARSLVKTVYVVTEGFPVKEKYGLTAQLRRASVSVPSNIAEGAARSSTKEFIRFLDNAYASLAELETQLFLAQDLGYIRWIECEPEIAEIGKMINGLQQSLHKRLVPTLTTDH